MWTRKYFYCCYRIYICVKKIILFSLFTSQFFIQKFICILNVKSTGMNKGEQVKNLKLWVNILFQWPQSLFAATKIYTLIFNLTHSLISLMGSFHFPQWKIFFPIHWQILKVLGNGISQLFVLSLKCDHPVLCEFSILFSILKLELGQTFSQLIHRFNIGILKCCSVAVYISKSFQIHKRREIGIFEKPRLHFQIFPNSLKSLKIEIFSPYLHIWLNDEAEAEGGHVTEVPSTVNLNCHWLKSPWRQAYIFWYNPSSRKR